jgi:hypothetical protein
MQAMLALRIKKLLHDARCEVWGDPFPTLYPRATLQY